MIVNTRYLFASLLKTLGIEIVGDVGSMDGADARYFCRSFPAVRGFAFEPNPENMQRMRNDADLLAAGISLVPLAAADFDGTAGFFIIVDDSAALRDYQGMGSLLERPDHASLSRRVQVATTRLDTYFRREAPQCQSFALWIDVEGKAAEVVAGLTGIASAIRMIHIEVETVACIAREQKLRADVDAALRAAGFVELATDRPIDSRQFNSLYVRGDLLGQRRLAIAWRLIVAWTRRAIARRLDALQPALAQRIIALMRKRDRRDTRRAHWQPDSHPQSSGDRDR
ncbi:MAG: FkbM family methyltransferase [Pseudomonadota bacterium]